MEEKSNVFTIEIKVEKEEFEKGIQDAFKKKVKDIQVDGFRKGKVPFDVYVKKFGKESLYMDAVDELLPSAYEKAIKEGNYEPIIEPKADLKDLSEDGCTFVFTITTRPVVNIKKYKGLKVKKETYEVTNEEVQVEIDNMLQKYGEVVIKEYGEVEEGNIAIIDFEGFLNDVPFDGGKGENYSLEIGSNTFIPGFEDQIIGMKKDETKDINVTFPEDYPAEELKGKEVIFKVKVNEIKEKVERKLDEDFFADLAIPEIDSKEKLEEEIKKSLQESKDMEIENKFIDDLLKEIANNTEVDIPQELIDTEIDYMIRRFEEQLMMQGLSLDVYLEMTKTTKDALKEQMMEEATNHVKYRFILEEIKTLENIEVTDEEVKDEVTKMALTYNMEEDELVKAMGGLDSVKYEKLMNKIIDFIKENN